MKDQKPIWSDWFYLDSDSPSGLRWAVTVYCGKNYNRTVVVAGDQAGHNNGYGYWKVALRGRNFLVHRIVYEMSHGIPLTPREKVDHKDGNRANNKVENLRLGNPTVNNRNRGKSARNRSGKTGVSENKDGYFIATATSDGKNYNKCFSIRKLGRDEAFRLACECRDRMIEELNNNGAGYSERHGT